MKKAPRSKAPAKSLHLRKETIKNMVVQSGVRAGRACCMSYTRNPSYTG
jgi:hypothetical protein